MTTPEYDRLCHQHGFPRIDGDNDSADRELQLINLARIGGGSFKRIFNTHYIKAWGRPFFKFPEATTAKGQTKDTNTDTMNIEVNLNVDLKAIDAINNLAAAISGRSLCNPAIGGQAVGLPEPASTKAEPVTEEVSAPRKTKAKEKMNPAPAPKTAETEPDPLENVPTGEQLLERTKPLKDTPYIKQLRTYMDEQLGLKGTGLRAVTDVDDLKKIDLRITELLAEAEDANGNAGDDV